MAIQGHTTPEQMLYAELENRTRDLETAERELHFLRLDAMVKGGIITDLRCRISELEELRASSAAAIEALQRKKDAEIDAAWREKVSDVAALQSVVAKRDEAVAALNADLVNSVNERMLLEAYLAHLRTQVSATHDPGLQSARLAIAQAWTLTLRAIRRRLFGR